MSHQSVAENRIKLRLDSLSDLVFGLALSIGSIALFIKLPQTDADFVTSIVAFGFSFLIVTLFWVSYTRVRTILPEENSSTFFLCLLLLFCVVLEPYLFYVVLSVPQLMDWASIAYSLDLGIMFLIVADLIYTPLMREGKRLQATVSAKQMSSFRKQMIASLTTGILLFVSALPFFSMPVPFNGLLRITMWDMSMVVFVIIRLFPTSPRPADVKSVRELDHISN